MWNINYDKLSDISLVLEANGLAMSKKLGQNFLIDKNARERIAEIINAKENSTTWEIGPGLGAITSLVLAEGAYVKAFELDKGFCTILGETAFSDEEKFTLVAGDALKTLFREKEKPEIIYGNLPYNVGSVCIAKLIENSLLPERMVFTLQKEVVERMVADFNSENYSSFSILCQIDYNVSYAFTINQSCFYPIPKVDSAVVLMQKRENSLVSEDIRPLFLSLVRELFKSRRKNIRNNMSTSKFNLTKQAIDEILEKANLSPTLRAEAIEINDLINLAKIVKEYV